jgi:hypothetical protein
MATVLRVRKKTRRRNMTNAVVKPDEVAADTHDRLPLVIFVH